MFAGVLDIPLTNDDHCAHELMACSFGMAKKAYLKGN